MNSQLTYMKKPELLKELELFKGQFFAVIDEKVKFHLPEWVTSSENVYWLTDPEESKCLEKFEKAVSFFLDQGISRASCIIGIGGGATTDLAGFVAATILRGVKWIAVPTTLLAMVDGSLGGKVAINMPQGKNLLGAFHSPDKILICYDFLSTLPEIELESGKGEILKYGFLSTKINHAILNHNARESISSLCSDFKMNIVDNDFKEQGERVLLNLGHTLGHAFEMTLKIPHGLAVAMGLRYLFEVLGESQHLIEWEKMLKSLGMSKEVVSLTNYPEFNVDKFINYLKNDKKKEKQSIRLVLVKKIGDCFTSEMSLCDFILKIRAHAEFSN